MTAPYISGTENRVGPMSDDEIELHKRNAIKMSQQGASLAQVKAYMDSAGVPQKKKLDYSPDVSPQYILGAVTSALHGATYGWDDEAVGSLYGLVTGSGAQAGRDAYRAHLANFHNANPGTDLALQLAGGVGGAALTGGVSGGVRVVAPRAMEWLAGLPGAIKAIGAAGLGGAAYAAGDAQGGVGERLGAAPGGAATGALLGGAITGGAFAAGQVIKPIARSLPVLKKAFASAGEQADDVVSRDLLADKVRIPDLIDQVKTNSLRGQPTTIADVAGENTRGRMAAIQGIPGEGKDAIRQGLAGRQSDAGDRLVDWLKGKSKLGLGNVEQTRNGLLGARAMQAETLYDDAYQQSAPLTDKLKALFQNDKFKKAYNEARIELRTSKGIDVPPLSKPFFPEGAVFKTPGQAGPPEAIYPPDLPIAGLDWTKRYLDKAIRRGFNTESGFDRGAAYGLSQQLKDALTEIDDLVPAYGLARKTYRGDSEVIDALDEGRKFLRTPADVVTLGLGGKSQAEVEAYKLGAIENLRDAIYAKKAEAPDIARTVFGGKEMERRIQALFGPEADEFLARVKTEARFAQTLRATQGSRTTPLKQAIEDYEQQSAGVIGNLLAGRPGSAMVAVARVGGAVGVKNHQAEIADALAHRYTLGLNDPAELIGYLLNLESRKPRPSRVPRFAAAIGGQTVAGQN